MRPAVVCLLLALGGCSSSDPELAKPCNQRPTATVEMGIGQYTYVKLGKNQGQGPFIDTDLQLGDFVWLGVGCEGLGPDVTLSYGIRDLATGVDLSVTTDQRPPPLTYDTSLTPPKDVAPGLVAYFQLPAAPHPRPGQPPERGMFTTSQQLVGDPVTVWADVTDACHPDPAHPVHGELNTWLEGFDTSTCVGCLDQACHAELAACDAACHAIQGCLDAYCVHLSAIGSVEEAQCQAYCQGRHPTGKVAHIRVATCVQDMTRGALCSTQNCVNNPAVDGTPSQFCYVQPPCFAYSIDYRHCVNLQDASGGPCAHALDTCNGAPDCVAYKACTGTCTTWAACLACQAEHPQGEALFEAHQSCIEDTCLAEGWLPHL